MIHENIELTGSFTVSGSFVLPSHPSSSAVYETGSLYHDSVNGILKVYTGTQWVTVGEQTASVAPVVLNTDIEYLLVAGGASGGSNGGGGGAGGYLSSSIASVSSGSSFTVTVGAGGSNSVSYQAKGNVGVDSSIAGAAISTITAIGGAGGGSNNLRDGDDGGSGGGAGMGASATGTGGSGTVGQGNDGGSTTSTGHPYVGAGGGGAGQVGANGGGSSPGDGGDGLQSPINGTLTYYAGGGGGTGGTGVGYTGPGGSGGQGGGGTGGTYNGNGFNATANTGGGGGASGDATTVGAGGSGVAIFAYNTGSLSGTGGIKTTRSDGYMVHTFNSSGTLTIAGAGEYPVANGELYQTVLYTGNGANTAGGKVVTGMNFQPDMLWITNRTTTGENWALVDVTRNNGGNILYHNLNNDEQAGSYITFNSDGFDVNTDNLNVNNHNYVAFAFKLGGTPVSNSDGDITSNVSANTEAGVSVVTYTASGAGSSDTIGHGLNSQVEFIITKRRTTGDRSWHIWHKDIASNGYLSFTTNASSTPNGNRAIATNSSTFIGESNSGDTMVAYCFHSVPGYSKVGSYTGNRPTDVTVNTGFAPRFVMIKCDAAGEDWIIIDSTRGDEVVYPSKTSTEAYTGVSLTSTGFTVHNSGLSNTNGANHIYLAIA